YPAPKTAQSAGTSGSSGYPIPKNTASQRRAGLWMSGRWAAERNEHGRSSSLGGRKPGSGSRARIARRRGALAGHILEEESNESSSKSEPGRGGRPGAPRWSGLLS